MGWPAGLQELSASLGVAPQRLFALAAPRLHRYVDIQVSKRNGGSRCLSIPISELKGIQRLVARILWPRFALSTIAHGYRSGRSIVSAAQEHVGRVSILKVDLADFFPSITARRVYGFFRKRDIGANTAFILTRLVTHRGSLPQGAPTSPGLSNAICFAMDGELQRLAQSWDLAVTRYSDDIAFSGRNFNWRRFAEAAEHVIQKHGFRVNHSKVQFFTPEQGRRVLGLNVGMSEVRMTRDTRRAIRAAFYNAANHPRWGIENMAQLRGYLAFHKMIYGSDDQYSRYRSVLATIRHIRIHELPT